jgi:hypothetical protein
VSTDDGKGAGPDVGLDGGLDGNGSVA